MAVTGGAVAAVVLAVAAVVALSSGGGDDPGSEDDDSRALADQGSPTTGPTQGPGDSTPAASTNAPRLAWEKGLGEETIGTPSTDGVRAYVGDSRGTVTALALATGEQAWQVDVGDEATGSAPTVAGDAVIVSASAPSLVQAFEAASGVVRWTVPEVWTNEPAVVMGDAVVVSSSNRVTAIGLADGAIRWDRQLEDVDLWTGLELAGDVLVGGSSDGTVVALDAATGAIRWVTPIPAGELTIWDVAVVGDHVLAYDDDGFVTGMPVATGADPWAVDAQASFPGSFGALGTDAAVYLESGELLVLDPATGTERRRLRDGSGTMLNLPGDPSLLVIAAPGALRALDPDGAQAWSTELPVDGLTIAFGPGTLVVTDFEGNVAAYRLP